MYVDYIENRRQIDEMSPQRQMVGEETYVQHFVADVLTSRLAHALDLGLLLSLSLCLPVSLSHHPLLPRQNRPNPPSLGCMQCLRRAARTHTQSIAFRHLPPRREDVVTHQCSKFGTNADATLMV